MRRSRIFASLSLIALFTVGSYGGEEKFIKKYAMMKILESCFGPEVLQQTRAEIKLAVSKCTPHEPSIPSTPPPPPPSPTTPQPSISNNFPNPGNGIPYAQQPLRPSFIAYRPNNIYPYPQTSPFYSGYPGQGAMLYQIPLQQSYGFPPNNFMYYGQQQYYGNQRMARGMDGKNFTAKLNMVKNVTCAMQNLGYLDEHFEPDYDNIKDRIRRMPISKELRGDLENGVTFCQDFSKCVPEDGNENNPLSASFTQPTFFFKCYNHKKLEACILKDIRENRINLDDNELVGAEMKIKSEADKLSTSVYEFLYGSDSNEDTKNFFKM